MLESPLRFLMTRTLQESIMGVVWIVIIVRLIVAVFEYLFWRVSLLNPGTLIGMGVGGCIGVLGFVLGHWDRFTGIALCLLGGCIGSGLYRFDDGPRHQQNRENDKLLLAAALRDSEYVKAIKQN